MFFFIHIPGHVGEFTKKPPPSMQLDELKALLFEANRRRKLMANYKVYGVRRLTKSRGDGAALFAKLGKWPQWRTLFTVV